MRSRSVTLTSIRLMPALHAVEAHALGMLCPAVLACAGGFAEPLRLRRLGPTTSVIGIGLVQAAWGRLN